MKYSTDELEFAISQYIDGTLKPLEQAALEEALATDESARTLLAEYRRLDEKLKATRSEPSIDHASFAAQIVDSLKEADAPVRHFKTTFTMRLVAAAAVVLIAVGLVGQVMQRFGNRHPGGGVESQPLAQNTSALVQGPSVADATNRAEVDVSVGAPPGFASAGFSEQAVISRPPQLVIESSALPAQDSAAPY